LKAIYKIGFGCLFTWFFCACKKPADRLCFKSSGKEVSIFSILKNVYAIKLYDDIDLEVIQSTRNEIEIKGGENLVKHVKFNYTGDTLEIKNNNRCQFLRDETKNMKVILYSSDLKLLKAFGYGNFLIREAFQTNKLRLENYGFGDMDVNLSNADSLVLILVANNKSKLRGTCKYIYTYAIGYNEVDALELNSVSTGVVYAYSGSDIFYHVNDLLYADQAGTGIVYYKGNPAIISNIPNTKIVKL
jgi:hypothetical protein